MKLLMNYYEVLGVSNFASNEEIKNMYVKLAKKFHPSVCIRSDAHERFVEISEAYEMLINSQIRSEYDRLLKNGKHTSDVLEQSYNNATKEAKDKAEYYSRISLEVLLTRIFKVAAMERTEEMGVEDARKKAEYGNHGQGVVGKILGGIIGFAIGGPLGAVGGAILGHNLLDQSDKITVICPFCKSNVQIASEGRWICPYCEKEFVYGNVEDDLGAAKTIYAMLGKLAKADGSVTEAEIEAVDQFAIQQLGLNIEQRKTLSTIFNEAKTSGVSFDYYVYEYKRGFANNLEMYKAIIELFFYVAVADGSLHPNEEKLIRSACWILGLSDDTLNEIKKMYIIEEKDDLDRYYKVLGCNPNDSTEVIKSNYKKLVHDFHPDTLIGKELPQAYIEFANVKFREVQEAYEKIMKKR